MRPLLLGMGSFAEQPGGLNRYVAELDRALRAEGLEPTTVVAQAGAGLLARVRAFTRAAGRHTRTADVVDAHFALYAALPLLTGRLRGLPLVAHFHGPWGAEGRVAGDGRAAAWAKTRVERAVLRRAGRVVTLSVAFRRLAIEQHAVPPWRLTVIPPGVDTAAFRPAPRAEARRRLGLPQDAWIAVSARRLTPRMGLETLIEAWAGVDALLVIAGEGPERAALERRAHGRRIRFAGRLHDHELADLLRAADVCIVPSAALEGFALIGLEALASGTPVVASAVGGLAEWLGRLDASCLVEPGDADALRRRLADARSGRAPLPGPEACRAFAEQFAWETTAARHAALYREAVGPAPERRPRVVYVDHCARLSGGELALSRLVPELPVDAHVILGEDGPLVMRLQEAGISVEVLPLGRRARDTSRWRVRRRAALSLEGLEAAVYAVRLARRLRRYRPDLVDLNSLKACIYGSAAARIAGVPTVWHVRDRLAPDYLPAAAIGLLHHVARRARAVVANSAATAAMLPPDVAATVIHSPVPTEPPAASGSRNGFVVGLVGRIAPWKGQDLFLEAFADAFPSGGARAILVGAPLFGEQEFERELHDRCRMLGLDGRVTFAGFQDDVASALDGLDALVHASRIPEPFGLAVAEGMAAGLAVIAPAAGGPAEMIEDGVTGMLYRPGDAAALAAALRIVAADPALRGRLGAAARERARAFAPRVVAEQTMAVYRGVLA